jgi:signal transduction histidine kinase
MNLITNAIIHSPRDLMVLVKLDVERESGDQIKIRFIVMDFGTGMPQNQIDSITKPLRDSASLFGDDPEA